MLFLNDEWDELCQATPSRGMTPRSTSAREQLARTWPLRALLVFGVLLAFMETVLYTALSPLIPELARELSLSATQVGTMTAAYPAGLVVASVPVGYAASRGGPRVTAVVGLWVLALGACCLR